MLLPVSLWHHAHWGQYREGDTLLMRLRRTRERGEAVAAATVGGAKRARVPAVFIALSTAEMGDDGDGDGDGDGGGGGVFGARCAVAPERLLGSASLIESDLSDRPELTPWLASLYVAPWARGAASRLAGCGGVAPALMRRVVACAAASGARQVFLWCLAGLRPYYERHGWTVLERDFVAHKELGGRTITIMARPTAAWSSEEEHGGGDIRK